MEWEKEDIFAGNFFVRNIHKFTTNLRLTNVIMVFLLLFLFYFFFLCCCYHHLQFGDQRPQKIYIFIPIQQHFFKHIISNPLFLNILLLLFIFVSAYFSRHISLEWAIKSSKRMGLVYYNACIKLFFFYSFGVSVAACL